MADTMDPRMDLTFRLDNPFGELPKYLVAPSIRKKFDALGYHFDEIKKDYQWGAVRKLTSY